MEYSTIEPWQRVDENGLVFDPGSLLAYFYDLLDPRRARGKRYRLATLVTLVFLAKMSGMDTPSAIADWCRAHREELVERLHLTYPRMPGHSTIRRLFETTIAEEDFEQRMRAYNAQQRGAAAANGLLALDGKKERGTIPPGETQSEATLAIYDPEREEVIAQAAIEPSEGEIPAGPKLLSQVALPSKVVLADALHTQQALSTQIVQAGGDYVWTVKDNQPVLRATLEQFFTNPPPTPAGWDFQTAHTLNKQHGRIEERTLTACSLLPGELKWPFAHQTFRLERSFTFLRKGQVVRTEHFIHDGLTSLSRVKADAAQLLALKRKYWQIETGLHYRRDVTFHEDATRMSHPHATRNLATVHNMLLSLFARLGLRNAAKARRFFDADPAKAFALLLAAHPRL